MSQSDAREHASRHVLASYRRTLRSHMQRATRSRAVCTSQLTTSRFTITQLPHNPNKRLLLPHSRPPQTPRPLRQYSAREILSPNPCFPSTNRPRNRPRKHRRPLRQRRENLRRSLRLARSQHRRSGHSSRSRETHIRKSELENRAYGGRNRPAKAESPTSCWCK